MFYHHYYLSVLFFLLLLLKLSKKEIYTKLKVAFYLLGTLLIHKVKREQLLTKLNNRPSSVLLAILPKPQDISVSMWENVHSISGNLSMQANKLGFFLKKMKTVFLELS